MRLDPIEQMKVAMKRAGVTQVILADGAGVHVSSLGNYLAGGRQMPDDVQERVWAFLKTAAEKKATEIRAEAEDRARQMIESAQVGAPA